MCRFLLVLHCIYVHVPETFYAMPLKSELGVVQGHSNGPHSIEHDLHWSAIYKYFVPLSSYLTLANVMILRGHTRVV